MNSEDHYYIYSKMKKYNDTLEGIFSYFGFFLLLNSMIPISLVISLDAARLF